MTGHEELADRISVIPEPCLTRAEAYAIIAEVLRELAASSPAIEISAWLRASLLALPKEP
jgi:hypothetical protein